MRISDWSSDVCSSDLDDLGALVGVVHGDTVAQRAQAAGDEGGEGGIAALAFEVADHHVGARGAGAVGGDGGADRLHGMHVEMPDRAVARVPGVERLLQLLPIGRSEEHTSELQSLMRSSYAVFCLKKNNYYLTQ